MRTSDGLTVVEPGAGYHFGDITVLARASDGDGRWGAVIVRGARAGAARTHLHRGAAEAFLILEGDLELLGATSTTPIGPGTFVLIPPDTEHGLRVISGQARWLAIWPPMLDGLPEELAAAAGEPERIAGARTRHGVEPGGREP